MSLPIVGDNKINFLSGTSDDDTIYGLEGDDSLSSGAGPGFGKGVQALHQGPGLSDAVVMLY